MSFLQILGLLLLGNLCVFGTMFALDECTDWVESVLMTIFLSAVAWLMEAILVILIFGRYYGL